MHIRSLAFAGVLVAAATAHASSITYGSFESGDFTGWQTLGVATVGSYSPTDGLFNARISNTDGSVHVPDIAAFANVRGPMPGISTYGSAIKTTFSLSPGEAVAFDWRFESYEFNGVPYSYPDYAFMVIDGTFWNLYQVQGGVLPGAGAPPGALDQKSSTLLLDPGTHTISFGVMNGWDTSVESQLFIDNLHTTTDLSGATRFVVPLPAAAWSALPILGTMMYLARRRHLAPRV